MFKAAKRRITYANVAATLALVFAMSGGAYAAKRYLITSTGQINPKVLKSLKGASGKNGSAGAQGPAGTAGAAGAKGDAGAPGGQGPQGVPGEKGEKGEKGGKGTEGEPGQEGSPWTAGGTLPSGATETGAWTSGEILATTSVNVLTAISFSIPLEKALDAQHVHYVTALEVEEKSGPSLEHCPGTVEKPQAEPGELCVFQGGTVEEEEPGEKIEVHSITPPSKTPGAGNGSSSSGAVLLVHYEGPAERGILQGTWAVTAP
jgi:Collagen triple helix repeat (20 copies)